MSIATKPDKLAEAIRATLIRPNVSDSNWEPANVVDVLEDLANKVGRGLDGIADAIRDLAEAIRERERG
jgi:hypothetical protein